MLVSTQKTSYSFGKYRADVVVLGANATEQVNFWDSDGKNHLLHSCTFESHNLGRGTVESNLLDVYTRGLLNTVRRKHKRTLAT